MAAGDLRERVRFERNNVNCTDDGYGNTVCTWGTIAGPIAARIRPLREQETIIAQRLEGISVFEVTVRWCADTRQLQTADRMINERTAQIYNVTSVLNVDEHRRYMNILATLGEAAGPQ